jgi:hypothetical protein
MTTIANMGGYVVKKSLNYANVICESSLILLGVLIILNE